MVYGLIAILCFVVFALDVVVPLGVAGGVPYVAAVVLALYAGSRRVVMATAVVCSFLTLVGYFVSPSAGGIESWEIIANRSLAIFAIWTTSAISAHMPGDLRRRQHRPTTFLTFAALFTFLVLISMNWLFFRSQAKSFEMGQRESRVANLSSRIIYLDETLTMSARMAAATGDLSWEERYRSREKELELVLLQAAESMPQLAETEAALTTAAANTKLVAMENRVFDLVRRERLQAAAQLLNSDEYEKQKEIYTGGQDECQNVMLSYAKQHVKEVRNNLLLHAVMSAIAIGTFIGIWFAGARLFARWRRDEETYHKKLQEHAENLTREVKQRELAQDQAIQASKHLETRAKELEQFNELAVGRELRMIELKQEVNDLTVKVGLPPVYDIRFSAQEVAL
jgi:hypothetical protein